MLQVSRGREDLGCTYGMFVVSSLQFAVGLFEDQMLIIVYTVGVELLFSGL